MANLGQTKVKGAKAYQGQQIVDRNSLVIKYAPLVKRVALHLKSRLPSSVDLNDLIQAGMIGLIESIHHYKEGQGAVFETYASIRIKGAMLDDLRQSDWTPRGVHQNTRAIRESMSRLSHRYGRPATDLEIAADLNVDINRYHQMLLDSNASQIIGIEDTGLTDDVISGNVSDESEDKLFESLNNNQFKEALKRAIESLPERESKIVSFYYEQELNLREIGLILGISESRTCQILSQALLRVRYKLSEWDDNKLQSRSQNRIGGTDSEASRADKAKKYEHTIAQGAETLKPEVKKHKASLLFDENGEIIMRTAKGVAAEEKKRQEQRDILVAKNQAENEQQIKCDKHDSEVLYISPDPNDSDKVCDNLDQDDDAEIIAQVAIQAACSETEDANDADKAIRAESESDLAKSKISNSADGNDTGSNSTEAPRKRGRPRKKPAV